MTHRMKTRTVAVRAMNRITITATSRVAITMEQSVEGVVAWESWVTVSGAEAEV